MEFEERARRMRNPELHAAEAAKAASYIQKHPGCSAREIALSIGIKTQRLPWVISELIYTGEVVKRMKYHNRAAKYYLKGQVIPEEEYNTHSQDAEILRVADKLFKKRHGQPIRAKDVQYAMEEQGLEVPSNHKISQVLLANRYDKAPDRSRYGAAYILVSD